MKISLTPDELITGRKVSRFGKQLDDIKSAVRSCIPLALSRPVYHEGDKRQYSVIRPTGMETADRDRHVLTFIPVWAKCFLVCNAQDKEIQMMTLHFDKEQVSFTFEGHRPTSFTTGGPGIGAKAEEEAEKLLARVLTTDPGSPVVRNAMTYIAHKFTP